MKKSELPVGSVIKLVSGDVLCVKFQDSGDPGRDFRYVSTGHVCEYDSMHKVEWDLVSAPGAKLTDDAYFSDPRVQMLATELTKTQAAFDHLRRGNYEKFETALNETATPERVIGPIDWQAMGIPGITDEEVEAFNAALRDEPTTFDEFMQRMLAVFPNAQAGEDNDGQLIVYTGMEISRERQDDGSYVKTLTEMP